MPKLPKLIELIDSIVELKGMPRHPLDGPRHHLGASIIGRECLREIWYSWRWAGAPAFEGRMLRLFERGHDEEPRLAELLRIAGAYVWELDPATGKQFRFLGYKGHFAGGCDGIATGVPLLEDYGLSLQSRLLCEFKTHSYDRYKDVEENPIKKGKPEHYVQTVLYMDELKLDAAIYVPVCKDDDRILPELIMPDPAGAQAARDKARYIIDHPSIPPRMAHAGVGNYKCKICDFRRACHFGSPLAKNCRTCKFSAPVDGGRWQCNKFNALIPKENEIDGCPAHEQIKG